MPRERRSPGERRGLSWRAVVFLMLGGMIATTFFTKHRLAEEMHLNYLDDVEQVAARADPEFHKVRAEVVQVEHTSL